MWKQIIQTSEGPGFILISTGTPLLTRESPQIQHTMTPQKLQETALNESCTEYLAYLFVNTSQNGGYRVPKTDLDDEHLMFKYA